ncbi:hypothetical protein GIB67_025766, partial [Kingdonia uniflora]
MTCCGLETHSAGTRILAVILDLDGTLLDTERATKDILKDLLRKYGKVVDREMEDNRFGMMHKEFTETIVKDYDLPLTPDQFSNEILPFYHQRWPLASALPGANRLIRHLHKHGVPLALASNSRTNNIEEKISHQQGWKELFAIVLGSDQVNAGKPSPDIFLEAAKRIGVDPGYCLVIEDSLVGVMAAKAAGMKVVVVPSVQTQADRYSVTDFVLLLLLEFQPEPWGLPAFEDWVMNALPIEPMHVKGLLQKGFLLEVADDVPSSLADQVSKVCFGWAKLNTDEILKVVVGIGWKWDSCTTRRLIQPLLIGKSNKFVSDHFQVLLVGFIRGLRDKEKKLIDIELVEEDKLIT